MTKKTNTWGGVRSNLGKKKGKKYSELQHTVTLRVSQESKEILEKQANKSEFTDKAIKESKMFKFLDIEVTPFSTVEEFKTSFERFISSPKIAQALEASTTPMQQKAIIADTLIFLMDAEYPRDFSYGDAYFAVGIPKEFLR